MQLIKFTTKAGFCYINPAMIQAVDKDSIGSYIRLSNYSQGVLEPIEKVLELLGYTESRPITNPIDKTKIVLKKPTTTTKKKAKKR